MRATLDTVTLERNGRSLVSDIDLRVEPAVLTALVGPNGAGKTTLIRILAGDVSPTRGVIKYGDELLDHISVRRRARLRAVLAQSHASDTSFTVEQVVSMGRYAYRLDRDADVNRDLVLVNEAIESLDLNSLRNRQIRFLSGGEQQRVAIARVLAQRTPLILLDEPTTALDVGHQESVMSLIKGLRQNEHAVVAVLHYLNLATYFDQVVLMDEGRMVAAGPPADVMTSSILSAVYKHPIDVLPHPTREGLLVLPKVADPSDRRGPAST